MRKIPQKMSHISMSPSAAAPRPPPIPDSPSPFSRIRPLTVTRQPVRNPSRHQCVVSTCGLFLQAKPRARVSSRTLRSSSISSSRFVDPAALEESRNEPKLTEPISTGEPFSRARLLFVFLLLLIFFSRSGRYLAVREGGRSLRRADRTERGLSAGSSARRKRARDRARRATGRTGSCRLTNYTRSTRFTVTPQRDHCPSSLTSLLL